MIRTVIRRRSAVIAGFAFACLAAAAPLQAATIWTDWTAGSIGNPGAALGALPGVGVLYTGELDGGIFNGTSTIWAPNSSFVGGTVTTSPSVVGDDLRLDGSFSRSVNTVTFSSAVTNPLIAIWSLGAPGLQASFNFIGATPTLQAGGPNAQFGGGPLSVVGNSVFGSEGNGVVEFAGVYTSLSWTNTFENFYAFTVGVNGPGASVPEPLTITLLGAGLVGMIVRRRRVQ
jgi:hypothetical protein